MYFKIRNEWNKTGRYKKRQLRQHRTTRTTFYYILKKSCQSCKKLSQLYFKIRNEWNRQGDIRNDNYDNIEQQGPLDLWSLAKQELFYLY